MSEDQDKFQCQGADTCGYIYDPDRGDKKGKVPRGTAFKSLPDDWKCPGCGMGKERFKCLGEPDCEEKNKEITNGHRTRNHSTGT
jgi:rubredoxin